MAPWPMPRAGAVTPVAGRPTRDAAGLQVDTGRWCAGGRGTARPGAAPRGDVSTAPGSQAGSRQAPAASGGRCSPPPSSSRPFWPAGRVPTRATGGTRAALVASAWLIVLFGSASLAASDDDEGLLPPPTAVYAGPPLPAPRAAALPEPVAAPLPLKILRSPGVDVDAGVLPSRTDEGCSGAADIAIYQAHASSLPGGVPAYKVDVVNRCLGGLDGGGGGECAIAGIHVRCGWFSSASLVDPRKFRRLGHDDCLLNDGRALRGGETVSFEYANSFPYPLTVRLATCVDPTAASSP